MQEWVPFLEQVLKSGHALVCVTKEITRELLQLFVVNDLRGTLHVTVIEPAGESYVEPSLRAGEIPQGSTR